MKTYLLYKHNRDIFKGGEFKPFVYKYFHNPRFEGTEWRGWYPIISVTNYRSALLDLPKIYTPIKAHSKIEHLRRKIK